MTDSTHSQKNSKLSGWLFFESTSLSQDPQWPYGSSALCNCELSSHTFFPVYTLEREHSNAFSSFSWDYLIPVLLTLFCIEIDYYKIFGWSL